MLATRTCQRSRSVLPVSDQMCLRGKPAPPRSPAPPRRVQKAWLAERQGGPLGLVKGLSLKMKTVESKQM